MNPGRLSLFQAAFVVARRDFAAVLFSRAFFFFLLGPLFPVIVGAMAGMLGGQIAQETNRAAIGIAMTAPDTKAMLSAHTRLTPKLGNMLPRMEAVPNGADDPAAALEQSGAQLIAVVSGTPAAPVLTGPKDSIERWQGPVSLIAAQAAGQGLRTFPAVALASTASSSGARERSDQIRTAQTGQTVLFLLTMLLAGMVLSNLVEEKGNKVIEILAAAIPMDAV
ncbi:MAG: ABC transporter permease, partial [Novosphingobium sp.]|nr:ABC transporter permease [Novosphingobium sp.]